MRFLVNENIPLASAQLLRARGHDVVAIGEISPGATDLAVIERANQEDRIIVTFDRDYGELIFRGNAPTPGGVIYLRLIPSTPSEPAEVILGIERETETVFERRFSVISRQDMRQRPLP